MLLLEVLLGAWSNFFDRAEIEGDALLLSPCPLLAFAVPGGVFLGFFVLEVISARKALGFPAPNPPLLLLGVRVPGAT